VELHHQELWKLAKLKQRQQQQQQQQQLHMPEQQQQQQEQQQQQRLHQAGVLFASETAFAVPASASSSAANQRAFSDGLIATTAAQGSLLSEALQSAAQNLDVAATITPECISRSVAKTGPPTEPPNCPSSPAIADRC